MDAADRLVEFNPGGLRWIEAQVEAKAVVGGVYMAKEQYQLAEEAFLPALAQSRQKSAEQPDVFGLKATFVSRLMTMLALYQKWQKPDKICATAKEAAPILADLKQEGNYAAQINAMLALNDAAISDCP